MHRVTTDIEMSSCDQSSAGLRSVRGVVSILAGLVRGLAPSRRQSVALRGESESSQPRVLVSGLPPGYPSPECYALPGDAMRCCRCGFAVDAFAFQRDRGLLSASCCPRCDGQLGGGQAGSNSDPRPDPSIYLG